MCSVRVCKISWNDSGAVYLGMDKIRNPDAEKTNVPVRKSLFCAVEPVIKKYEKESLKKEGRKKNDKNAE